MLSLAQLSLSLFYFIVSKIDWISRYFFKEPSLWERQGLNCQKNNNFSKALRSWLFFGVLLRFLAAMGSSRSDVVTKSVRSSVCLFIMKEFFFSLRSYKGVSWKPNACFNEVSRMFHASFMDRKFQGCFKKVSRVL